MAVDREAVPNTETLREIDVSVIAQPSIKKNKALAKKQRKEEIKTQSLINDTISNSTSALKKPDSTSDKKLPSSLMERKKTKITPKITLDDVDPNHNPKSNPSEETTSPEKTRVKRIELAHGAEPYNIKEDLNNRFASITFGQLLDICPKLRAQLNKALRLKSIEYHEDNIDKIMLSTISKDDIATSKCLINGVGGFAFLDTCASINIVTRNFIEKLGGIKPFGYTTNNIIQVTSKAKMKSELYVLTITFGNLVITGIFRVIEDSQGLFDILIGYNTLKDHALFINPIDNYLCKMNDDGSWERVTPLSTEETLLDDENQVEELENENELEEQDESNSDSLVHCFICERKTKCNINKSMILMSVSDEKEALLEDIIKQAPRGIRRQLGRLFKDYKEVLAISIEELGGSKLLPHSITLEKDVLPIKQKAYRLSKDQAQALKKEIVKLLKNKLIEPSSSPWSSPVILVLKKNGKWRMCVDYRKLNLVTLKDAYSIPLIDDILFFIGRRIKMFTTIDLFAGFHQIPMNPDDIPKTSFTTAFGNYQFLVMPFGLCNAPGTFQREMNRIFFPLIGKCLFVYIDDLIIFSETPEDHLKDLERVFAILRENGIKLNLEKCNFFKTKVELLGHTVSTEGISPLPKKVEVIAQWLPPTTITQLQSFLGAVGYYRKFILNFASIAKPLFRLLKKDVEFKWGKEENESPLMI